MQGGKNIKGKI